MTLLTLFTPAGVLARAAPLRRAARRLSGHGFDVHVDESALVKHQRFAGDDDTRLAALHRVAHQAPGVALATRGGYGLTRLLDRIDWKLIARSVERGTRWVGQSDLTALQLGLLAHGKGITWAGPLACDDFGGEAVDDITEACFLEAMSGELEAVGFRTEPGFDGLQARGTLWGGNLCMLCSLLGTAESSFSKTSTSTRTASSAACCNCTRPACWTRKRPSCWAPSATTESRRWTAAIR